MLGSRDFASTPDGVPGFNADAAARAACEANSRPAANLVQFDVSTASVRNTVHVSFTEAPTVETCSLTKDSPRNERAVEVLPAPPSPMSMNLDRPHGTEVPDLMAASNASRAAVEDASAEAREGCGCGCGVSRTGGGAVDVDLAGGRGGRAEAEADVDVGADAEA